MNDLKELDFIPFDFADEYFEDQEEQESKEVKQVIESSEYIDPIISKQLILPLPLSPWHSEGRVY